MLELRGGKKTHGKIGIGNVHLTNDPSMRKLTGKILTLHPLKNLTLSEKKVSLYLLGRREKENNPPIQKHQQKNPKQTKKQTKEQRTKYPLSKPNCLLS